MPFIPHEIVARYADKKPAYKRAYLILRTALLEGAFDADGRCTESDLSAELGMSRTPIRKALDLLDEEGMTVHFGQTDSELSPSEKEGLLVLLSHLEGQAASRAAIRATPGWLELLEKAMIGLKRTSPSKGDVSRIRVLDLQLHLLIARRSKSDFLYDEISRVRLAIKESRANTDLYTDERHLFNLRLYRYLVDSLRARDPYLSEQWARTCVLSMLPLFR